MAEGLQLGPEEVSALRAALMAAEARAAAAEAKVSDNAALIAHLKLEIAKLGRDRFDPSSERSVRLVDQLELQLEELEASATADEIAAQTAAAKATTHVAAFTRRRPSRQTFPSTCLASAWCSPLRPPAHVAAAAGYPSLGRMSPRRWR